MTLTQFSNVTVCNVWPDVALIVVCALILSLLWHIGIVNIVMLSVLLCVNDLKSSDITS